VRPPGRLEARYARSSKKISIAGRPDRAAAENFWGSWWTHARCLRVRFDELFGGDYSLRGTCCILLVCKTLLMGESACARKKRRRYLGLDIDEDSSRIKV
jgi:hypothetical protein